MYVNTWITDALQNGEFKQNAEQKHLRHIQ